jgi:hypothetical protein
MPPSGGHLPVFLDLARALPRSRWSASINFGTVAVQGSSALG